MLRTRRYKTCIEFRDLFGLQFEVLFCQHDERIMMMQMCPLEHHHLKESQNSESCPNLPKSI